MQIEYPHLHLPVRKQHYEMVKRVKVVEEMSQNGGSAEQQ